MHPPSHQDYHETPAASRQRIRHLSQGFTLIELLVVIAVAVIMATWALPNFQHMIARHEVASEAIRIRTALATARHAAVSRGTTVTLCAVSQQEHTRCDYRDWSQRLIIVEGQAPGGELSNAPVVSIFDGGANLRVTFSRHRPIRHQAGGWSRGHNGTFMVCGRRGHSTAIVLSNAGRVRSESGAHVSC